ncbi:MAG: hypothetical protein AB7L13_16475 [Acidimicrobiia bacterium]
MAKAGTSLLVIIGLLALAPATWWSRGPLSPDPDSFSGGPDYLWEPLALSDGTSRFIGLVSIVVAVVAAVVGGRAIRRSAHPSSWLGVVAALAALSMYVVATWRVASSPVNGANIGGGLLIMGAAPAAVVAAVVVWTNARRLRTSGRAD